MKREYAIDKLIENSDKCINMLDLCHRIGIENVGGEDYREVKELAKKLGIVLKFSFKKEKKVHKSIKRSNELIFTEGSNMSTTALKRIICREGLKTYKCDNCGITEWQNKPLSLQLHHINGNRYDNRLENLQFLCPNCHSQTDNYAGKNIFNKNKKNNIKVTTDDEYKKLQEENWKQTHPSVESFISSFLEIGSFVGVGKKYGVSDNTIRKWCVHYGLPIKKQELKKFLETSE